MIQNLLSLENRTNAHRQTDRKKWTVEIINAKLFFGNFRVIVKFTEYCMDQVGEPSKVISMLSFNGIPPTAREQMKCLQPKKSADFHFKKVNVKF